VQDNAGSVSASLPRPAQVRSIRILRNDSLTQLPTEASSSGAAVDLPSSGQNDRYVTLANDLYEIGDNAQLTRIESPNGFSNLQQVSIWGNPALSILTLNYLERADGLHIVDNASLKTLVAPQLERVGDLEVVNNPQLSTSVLLQVQTFTRTMSGNGDALAP